MVKDAASNPTLLHGLEFYKNFGKALCDYYVVGRLAFNEKEQIGRPRETVLEFALFLKTCGNTDIISRF